MIYLHPGGTLPISYHAEGLRLSSFHFGPLPEMAMRTLVVYKNLKTGKSFGSPWVEHTRAYCFGFVIVEAHYSEYSPDPLP